MRRDNSLVGVGQGRFYLMENIKAWLYHYRTDSVKWS